MNEVQHEEFKPGDYGTWSRLPLHPTVEKVQNPGRRQVLKVAGVLGLTAVEFGAAAVARRAVENANYLRELSEHTYLTRVESAARHPPQDFILYPAFEKKEPPEDLWSRVDRCKKESGEISIGMFTTLQQIDDEDAISRITQHIRMIQHRGGKFVLSLGADSSGLDGEHPFALVSEEKMESWMGKWVEFLRRFHIAMDIRFLFEMNVDRNGYVAYRRDRRVDDGFHAERFKYLFSRFYDMIHRDDETGQPITVSVCGTCDGTSLESYVPRQFDGFGLDAFDFTEGNAPIAPVNTLIGVAQVDANILEKMKQVDAIVEAYSSKNGVRVLKKIYEFGSIHDSAWESDFASYALSQGYAAIGHLDIDKSALPDREPSPTEKDWRLSESQLGSYIHLFSDIKVARKRYDLLRRGLQFIFGKTTTSSFHQQE